jgi:hypothetical protein
VCDMLELLRRIGSRSRINEPAINMAL